MNHITDRKLSENLDLTASVRDLKVIRVIFCDHYVATPQELCENMRYFIHSWWFSSADLVAPSALCTACVCVWIAAVVSVARCVYSSGGLAAEEPGERS